MYEILSNYSPLNLLSPILCESNIIKARASGVGDDLNVPMYMDD